MAQLCKAPEKWSKSHHRDPNSLWGRLSANVLGDNGPRDRLWFHTIFNDNRHDVQAIFRKIAGEEKAPIPLAASTPKPKERICICKRVWNESDPPITKCNKCKNWFHLLCVCQSKRQDPASGFICPICPTRGKAKLSSLFVPLVLVESGSPTGGDASLQSITAIDAGSQSTNETLHTELNESDQPPVSITNDTICAPNDAATENAFRAPSLGPITVAVPAMSQPVTACNASIPLDSRMPKDDMKEHNERNPQVRLQEEVVEDDKLIDDAFLQGAPEDTDTESDRSETSEPQKPRCFRRIVFNSSDSCTEMETLTHTKRSNSYCSLINFSDEYDMHERGSYEGNCRAVNQEPAGPDNGSSDSSEKKSPRGSPPGRRLYSRRKSTSHDDSSVCSVVSGRSCVTAPLKVVQFKESQGGKDVSPAPSLEVDFEDYDEKLREKPEDLLETFTFEITNDEWRPLLLLSKNRSLPGGYRDLLRREFHRAQPFCDLAIECHKLNRDSRTNYFSATGYCRFTGCYTFKFAAAVPPKDERPMAVHVSSIGIFHHKEGEFKYPQIRDGERKRLANKLRLQTPTQVANQYYAKAQHKTMKVGNSAFLQEKQIFRQIRYEERLSDDFDPEPMIDLYRMYLSERRRDKDGFFVRQLSIASFRAILFLQSQLDALAELRALQHGGVVAHLDATGGLANALPREIEGTTKLFSYVISINSPKPNGAPLTIVEFILNQHDGVTIQRCLEYFNETAKEILKIPKAESLFARVEIDKSGALIYASIGAFHGMDRMTYLHKCWRVLFCGEKPSRPNIHICRRHSWCAIKDQKDKMYALPAKAPQDLLDGAIIAYLRSGNFASSYRRAVQLLTICGNEYRTDDVHKAINEINVRTTTAYALENQDSWLKFDVNALKHPSIWRGTPFGALFYAAYERIMEEKENIHSFELKRNDFYNKKFTEYLLKEIFPYTTLITHCYFDAVKDYLQEDTQAAVENTFRGIKIDENARQGPNKIGRYVRMRKATLEGTAKKFYHDVMWAKTSNKGPKESRNVKPGIKSKGPPFNPRKRKQKKQNLDEIPKEGWMSHKHRNVNPTNDSTAWFDLPGIEFIPWGKLAKDKSLYHFTNTCPIDNTMMVLQILYAKYELAREYFDESKEDIVVHSREILQKIRKKRFNDAKAIWMERIAKDNNYILSRTKTNNLWGGEDERALNPIMPIFEGQFYEVVNCSDPDHAAYGRIALMNIANYVHATINDAVDKINRLSATEKCLSDTCQAGFRRDVYADIGAGATVPPFLFIHLAPVGGKRVDRIEDIPHEIRLADECFELVACNLATNYRHFILAIWEGGQFLTYDGMETKRKYIAGVPTYDSVTTAWYVRCGSD